MIMLLFQIPSTFQQTKNGMTHFIAYHMTILVRIGMVFVVIWEMSHWKICFNFVLLLLLLNFLTGSRLEWMYISLNVNIRSSLTYLHGFRLLVLLPYLIKPLLLFVPVECYASKVKFRRHCKRFLEAAKLTCASKTKESITSHKLGSYNF